MEKYLFSAVIAALIFLLFYQKRQFSLKLNGQTHVDTVSNDLKTSNFEETELEKELDTEDDGLGEPVKGPTLTRVDLGKWHDTIFKKSPELVERHRHYGLNFVDVAHESHEPILIWLFVHVKFVELKGDGYIRFLIEDPDYQLWTEPFKMIGAPPAVIYAHGGRMVKLHAYCSTKVKVKKVEKTIYKLDGTKA